jgi:hypothetical protein
VVTRESIATLDKPTTLCEGGRVIGRTWRGLVGSVRERPGSVLLVAAVVVALHAMVPVVVLSLARKPVDYCALNAWLPSLPSFLLAPEVAVARKLQALPALALFWCSASNPYGVEWGFTVDVADLTRFVLVGGLLGAYFALWRGHRARAPRPGSTIGAGSGGVLGGGLSLLGLSTAPCSVMGCGAPVIPVVGLALVGLSSTTLKLLHDLSRASAAALLVVLASSVAYFAWRAGSASLPAPHDTGVA